MKARPHPFLLTDIAYSQLHSTRLSQSIILTGPTASGKSEHGKMVLSYLCALKHLEESRLDPSKRSTPDRKKAKVRRGPMGWYENPFVHGPPSLHPDSVPLPAKILLSAQVVLEAFGSAKTRQNDYSSRFGRHTKVYFGGTGGDIAGGHVTTYLLETSRVTRQASNESGFQIFYQILLGFKEKKKYHFKTMQEYKYLNNVRFEMSEETEFATTLSALQTCGFTPAKLDFLWTVLSCVLEIGNIEFQPISGGKSSSASASTSASTSASASASASTAKISDVSMVSVRVVESLLKLESGSLGKVLLQKTVNISRGKATTVEAKVDDAILSRDYLAKALYQKAFDLIVETVNETLDHVCETTMSRALQFASSSALSGESPTPDEPLFVSVLDMFGYENNDDDKAADPTRPGDHKNSFEQLCINFVDEKITNQIVKSFYKSDFDLYRTEEIRMNDFDYKDNQNIVDALEKRPTGIFNILEEACRYARNTDSSFLQKLITTHTHQKKGQMPVVEKDKTKDDLNFTIKNWYGDTTYDATGFLEKNKGCLGPHIAEVLTNSQLPMVVDFFKTNDDKSHPAATKSKQSSHLNVAKGLVDDLNRLLSSVDSTNIHVIRCINPNNNKKPNEVDYGNFTKQVVNQDVLSSVRMRQEGFSYKSSFSSFYDRFVIVIPPNTNSQLVLVPSKQANLKTLSGILVKQLMKLVPPNEIHKPDAVQFGTETIFIKFKTISSFEALRKLKLQDMDRAVVSIQATWRMANKKNNHQKMVKGASRFQATWRAIYYRQMYKKKQLASSILQKHAVGFLQRKRFQDTKYANKVIADWQVKMKARVQWHRTQITVRALHSLGRAFIVRQHVNRMLKAVNVLQACCHRFLTRMKIHRIKVKVALMCQGWVMGMRERRRMPETVAFLAEKRKERFRARAVKRAQNKWKGLMIRRRFKQLREAAQTLQQFARSFDERRRFLAKKRAAILLQANTRGSAARDQVGDILNENMVKAEKRKVEMSNRKEAMMLKSLNAKRNNPARVDTSGLNRAYRCDLLDVDILVDNEYTYPDGWSTQIIALDNELGKRGRRITRVEQGSAHTVALTDTGEVWTWGWSDQGQLGHGCLKSEVRPRPLENLMFQSVSTDVKAIDRLVTGKLSVREIAVGEDFTLALADTGQVYSWGCGRRGQLGHGDFQSISFPRCIHFLKWKTESLCCGSQHSCSIGHNGALYTWGMHACVGGAKAKPEFTNAKGDICMPSPLHVMGRRHEKRTISNPANGLDDTQNQRPASPGSNDYKLGVEKMKEEEANREKVKQHIKAISAGLKFTIALTDHGDVFSWGANTTGWGESLPPPVTSNGKTDGKETFFNQLGSKREDNRPHEVEGLKLKRKHHAGIVSISAGARHSVASNVNGQVLTWGWNEFGMLGIGDCYNQSPEELIKQKKSLGVHVVLGDLKDKIVTQVSAGWRHTAALTNNGEIYVWGQSSLSARDVAPKPTLPNKSPFLQGDLSEPTHQVYLTPTKIYRVGQGRTNAVQLHSSWSRNLSSFSCTVRHKPNEVQIGQDNLPDWNGYLTRKVNSILASGRTKGNIPKFAENDEDKDREFVLTYRIRENKFLTVKNTNSTGADGIHTNDRKGSTAFLGMGLQTTSKKNGALARSLTLRGGEHCFADSRFEKVVTVTGADIQLMKSELLRTLSKDLKMGNVDVRSYFKRGGQTKLTQSEEDQAYFHSHGYRMGSEKRERTLQEKGWSKSIVPSNKEKKLGENVAYNMDINRELKRREREAKRVKELSEQEQVALEEKEKELLRTMHKQRIAEERKQKKLNETMQWRKEKEKKKVEEGGIMAFFAAEHLVAASNDMYTPQQVKAIYEEEILTGE